MPREPKDDGSESVLGLIGVGETRKTSVTRRALLFGVAGAALTGTVVAAVVAGADEDARHRRALHPPVNPGPATVRTPGSLAGPAAAPIWSVPVDRGTRAVAVGAGSVLLTDGFGDVLGFDPHTGAAKWQPSVEFFLDSDSPLTVVGDTLYGFDADGDFLAVDASNGTLSWQVEFASSDVEIATVAGNAGPLVFSTGSIYERAGGKGVLWCVNTKLHGVEFNINDVDFNLAVAASEPAGVVVAADEISYRLTAYSINDQTVVWHKDAGNADAIGVPISPADCIAVSGNGPATGFTRWMPLPVRFAGPPTLRARPMSSRACSCSLDRAQPRISSSPPRPVPTAGRCAPSPPIPATCSGSSTAARSSA